MGTVTRGCSRAGVCKNALGRQPSGRSRLYAAIPIGRTTKCTSAETMASTVVAASVGMIAPNT